MSVAHVRLTVLTLAGLAVGAAAAVAILPQARERLFPSHTVKSWGEAQIGGPFELTDHTGKRVTDADYRGRTMLVLFGYTSCRDECPAALQVLAAALGKLGPEADRFVPVLVTADPEHDTPERLGAYVRGFHPRLVGLTGTPEEIARVLATYRVGGNGPGETGTRAAGAAIDRPTRIYAIGPDGRFRALLDAAAGVDAVTASLTKMR